MKRRLLASAMLFTFPLSACAQSAHHETVPVKERASSQDHCFDADGKGKILVRVGRESAAPSGAFFERDLREPYRVLEPGSIKTEDYIPSRVNVEVDADDRILAITCG